MGKGGPDPRKVAAEGFAKQKINEKAFDTRQTTKPFLDASKQQMQRGQGREQFATGQTQNLIQRLASLGQGQGPSLAEAQLRSATDRSLSQQLAAAASGRGVDASATARQLARQQQAANQQAAQQAAQARIQEGQQANALLASTLGTEGGQALQQAQNGISSGANIAQQQASNLQALEQLKFQKAAAQANLDAAKPKKKGFFGKLAGIAGNVGRAALALKSDEDQKKAIKNASKPTDEFLNAIKTKSFKYKEPKKANDDGRTNFGVMAQDIEKSEMGRSFVEDTPEGKMLNINKGFGAVLAAQARLNERLNKLDKNKKGK